MSFDTEIVGFIVYTKSKMKGEKMFDFIIIGSGPGGLALAYKLKARNYKVAVVEKDKWGGTCPNYGCDPTKVMMAVVEAKQHADQLFGEGLSGGLKIDWESMRQRKLEITDPYAERTFNGLIKSGIECIYGKAKFTSSEVLVVDGRVYSARKYIIATGSRARHLSIEGAEYLNDSNHFLNLEHLPQNITFLGTGPVGLELAQLAKGAGAHVTIIAQSNLKIAHFDKEIGEAYLENLKSLGIEFKSQILISKVEKTSKGLFLTGNNGFTLETDFVVEGVGRVPNIDLLNLDVLGVETSSSGVIVDEFLQSSNPNIYALGDVVAKSVPHLTPVSEFEGNYLGDNLEMENPKMINYPVIPSVVYGSTKMAEVGILEGENIKVKFFDTSSWYSYRRIADPVAKVKVAINDKKELVGASIISNVADELVNLITILIQKKVSLEQLDQMILAYPTIASDLNYFF